jgi:hypothetical protein
MSIGKAYKRMPYVARHARMPIKTALAVIVVALVVTAEAMVVTAVVMVATAEAMAVGEAVLVAAILAAFGANQSIRQISI